MAELKRNKMKKLIWLALLVFSCSLRAFAQNQTDACILNDAKDGQIVTVRGKAMDEPHDLGGWPIPPRGTSIQSKHN